MPYFDEASDSIVARIVYDGAPMAGKTTNLRRISEQVGEHRSPAVQSPGSTDRQTEYFDWLEFDGGTVDGRSLRCQLLSVPGQENKTQIRRTLLESADVVVFVTDSDPRVTERSQAAFALTREILSTKDRKPGLLVQANKQDGPAALSPAAVASQFDLTSEVPIVGAVAEVGQGVMHTFVLAVRLATDQATLLLSAGELGRLPNDMRGANQMLERLLALDPQQADNVNGAPGNEDGSLPTPPLAANIDTGHVWPPVIGRGYLCAAMASPAPVRSVTVGHYRALTMTSDGWVVQTFPQDVFKSRAEATSELVRSAQACVRNPRWYDEESALAVHSDAGGWRLWCVGRQRATLRERLCQATDEATLADALADVQAAERQLAETPPRSGLENAISLDTVVCSAGRTYVRALRYAGAPFRTGQLVAAAERVATMVANGWATRNS